MILTYFNIFVRIFQELLIFLIVEGQNYAVHCEVTTFRGWSTRQVFPMHNCCPFWVPSLRTSPFRLSVTPWELLWFPSLWTNGLGASDQDVEICWDWWHIGTFVGLGQLGGPWWRPMNLFQDGVFNSSTDIILLYPIIFYYYIPFAFVYWKGRKQMVGHTQIYWNDLTWPLHRVPAESIWVILQVLQMILTHWFAIYDGDQDGQLQLEAGWDREISGTQIAWWEKLVACCPHHVWSSFPILWDSQDYARLVADYQLPLTASDEIYTRVVKERLAGLDSWSHEGAGIFHAGAKSHEPGRSMTTIGPVLKDHIGVLTGAWSRCSFWGAAFSL